jgi:hypothetical protein
MRFDDVVWCSHSFKREVVVYDKIEPCHLVS